jgi:hypothetical protein
LLGKIGRNFAIGPREFGVHPINKTLKTLNTQAIQTLGNLLYWDPYIRYFSKDDY